MAFDGTGEKSPFSECARERLRTLDRMQSSGLRALRTGGVGFASLIVPRCCKRAIMDLRQRRVLKHEISKSKLNQDFTLNGVLS